MAEPKMGLAETIKAVERAKEWLDKQAEGMPLRNQPLVQITAIESALTHLRSTEETGNVLRLVIETRDAEAKAELAMQNATENYSDPSKETDAYAKAAAAASEAEKSARSILAAFGLKEKT